MVRLYVALPLDLRVAHVKSFLETAVRWDPSGDSCGRCVLEQGPKVRVRTFEEFVVAPLDSGLDPKRYVLVINNQVRGGVTLVCPNGRAELSPADRLPAGYSTGGRDPTEVVPAWYLPSDRPGTPTQKWICWVAGRSVTPQRVRQPPKGGGPIAISGHGGGAWEDQTPEGGGR